MNKEEFKSLENIFLLKCQIIPVCYFNENLCLSEKINKLVDGDKIQYIGWIEAKESYNFFEAADLVVFPGRHSVFWEQVAGQGIPMVCKLWDGTTHVDKGGNVVFLKESNSKYIEDTLNKLINNKEIYDNMKSVAKKEAYNFLYSNIAKIAIEEEIR